jgi:uncharacterized ion transporter superfamily protein YfcC
MKSGVNETLFFSYSFYASLFYIIVGGLLVLFERTGSLSVKISKCLKS